jgi:hypothetical protein
LGRYRLAPEGRQDWSLKIASQKVERSALSNSSNVEIVGWKTNDEWLALHRCADESKLQP